jgi:Lrp/AsnC family leucine-responsive transcriptional regulator
LAFHALLDPSKLDRALLIFIEVLMNRTTGDEFKEFAASVSAMREILECHMVAGGFDYLIKVRVRHMEAYHLFLAETLVHMPGVRDTRTYAVLEEVKNVITLPL